MQTFVSDINNIALYTDDINIWRRINSYNDHEILQQDTSSLLKWSYINKMKFHPQKCKLKVLSVALENRQYVLPFVKFPYYLGDICLDYVECEML